MDHIKWKLEIKENLTSMFHIKSLRPSDFRVLKCYLLILQLIQIKTMFIQQSDEVYLEISEKKWLNLLL